MGARNVSVYTRQAELPGWERAREHLYSDGGSTYAVRTRNGDPTSPNSGNVFVRSTNGLPETPPALAGVARQDQVQELDGTLVATVGGAEVTMKGGWIEAADEDVLPALEARHVFAAAGHEVKGISSSAGKFSFPDATTTAPAGKVVLKNGTIVPPPRRDKPFMDWEADFGIEFDPGFRYRGKRMQLPDSTIAELRDVTERFMDVYGDAVKRWRLGRITVTQLPDNMYAALEWKAGGPIMLNKRWWRDPEDLAMYINVDRRIGNLTPRAGAAAPALLAHELGHVAHGAIRLAEGMGGVSAIDKELIAVLQRHGGKGRYSTLASKLMSDTAAIEPAELAAEAVSEVLTGTAPSALAKDVYAVLQDRLGAAVRYQKVVGL
jgi:hypothetical protein